VSFIFGSFDRHDFAIVIVAALIVTLVGLAPAWANKVAFGLVAPSGQIGLIGPVAALLLGATVCGVLTTICRNLVTASMAAKAEVVTEAAIFSRVLSLPATFFKRFSSGNLANRVGNVYLLVQKMITAVFGSGLTALFALLPPNVVIAFRNHTVCAHKIFKCFFRILIRVFSYRLYFFLAQRLFDITFDYP
jgi:ABC-type bacteriocin/lantibiotic exporter with double-glycine peptidase domain